MNDYRRKVISEELIKLNMILLDSQSNCGNFKYFLETINLVHINNTLNYGYSCYFCNTKFYPRKAINVGDYKSICKRCQLLVKSYRHYAGFCSNYPIFKIIGVATLNHIKSLMIKFERESPFEIKVKVITVKSLGKVIRSRKNTDINKEAIKYIQKTTIIFYLLQQLLGYNNILDLMTQIVLNFITPIPIKFKDQV